MPEIVCIGWVTIDFVGYVGAVPRAGEVALAPELEAACGGRAANQAMAVSALDGDAGLIARLGTDPHAELLRHELEDMDVDMQAAAPAPSPTGMRLMAQPDGAPPGMVLYPGANEYLTADDINRHAAILRSAKAVGVTTEGAGSVILRALEIARAEAVPTVLTHTPGMEISDRLLAAADTVVVAASTATGLLDPVLARDRSEHAARVLLQRGARSVLLIAGQAVMVAQGDELRAVPTPAPIEDEDSIDAFVAGVLVGLAAGDELALATARGARAAGMLVSD